MPEPTMTNTAKAVARREPVGKPHKLAPPLEQAILLRDALRSAATAAHQLVRSLKQQKRESRIVAQHSPASNNSKRSRLTATIVVSTNLTYRRPIPC